MAKVPTNKYGQTKSQFRHLKKWLKAEAVCAFVDCTARSGPFDDATQWAKQHVWSNPLHIVQWQRREVAEYWMPETEDMRADLVALNEKLVAQEKDDAERLKEEAQDPPGHSDG